MSVGRVVSIFDSGAQRVGFGMDTPVRASHDTRQSIWKGRKERHTGECRWTWRRIRGGSRRCRVSLLSRAGLPRDHEEWVGRDVGLRLLVIGVRL